MKQAFYPVVLPTIFVLILIFVFRLFAAENGEQTVNVFLERILARQYEQAVAGFSDPLRLECSAQYFEDLMTGFEQKDAIKPNERLNYPERSITGKLRAFDPPKKTDHPAGPLWDSVLRFERAVARIRIALDKNKIVAFELRRDPTEPSPEYLGYCFNGPEIGRRLGLDHSLQIELLDVDGNKFQSSKFDTNWNLRTSLYRLKENLAENSDDRYDWIDPKDGKTWTFCWKEDDYTPKNHKTWTVNILNFESLPAGVYRIAVSAKKVQSPDDKPGILLTEPIRLDAQHKSVRLKQQLIAGGSMVCKVLDVETNKPIDQAYPKHLRWNGTRVPVDDDFDWKTNRYTNLLPGKYTFSVERDDRHPNDPVYESVVPEYVTEIENGKETEVVTKLRARQHSAEELDKKWPFCITGTIIDEAGNPLSDAEIELMGFLGHRPGSTKVKSDENGRYTIRFAQHSITAMTVLRDDQPTPDKPEPLSMAISAERPGFVWKGVRTSDGKMVVNPFFSEHPNRKVISRNDRFGLTSFLPEPSDAYKKEHDCRPETTVYPLKPFKLDVVMQPAVRFRGVVQFDETPEPPNDKNRWQTARLTFDLPRAETASGQPVFYGMVDDDFRFDVSALPQKIDAFLSVGIRKPESWKKDQIVSSTDFFKLPEVGEYDLVLKWKLIEKNGIRMRRIEIASITDSQNKPVELVYTRPPVPIDYQFCRWKLRGTVRDDLGRPVEDATVKLYRHNGWRLYANEAEIVKTGADGSYETEIKPGNRYSYGYELHGAEHGEFYAVRVFKDGYLQRNLGADVSVFFSDEEKPEMTSFTFNKQTAETVVPNGSTKNLDFILQRNPVVECQLLDNDGRPLSGTTFSIGYGTEIDDDWLKELKLETRYLKTDENGKCSIEKLPIERTCWFVFKGKENANDLFRTNDIRFSPGLTYKVKLRLKTEPDGSRRFLLESVFDDKGNDLTDEIIKENPRARPFLGESETKRGRDILQKTAEAISLMYVIEPSDVKSLAYIFHLGGDSKKINVDPFEGQRGNEAMGITYFDPLHMLDKTLDRVRFRLIDVSDTEIRLIASLYGSHHIGNGVSGAWKGYSSGKYDTVEFVLDAKTFLPKTLKTGQFEANYFDWTPLGDPKAGHFVPMRIVSKAGNMNFDFRFKIHRSDIWLFDGSVDPEKTEPIAWIDNISVARAE